MNHYLCLYSQLTAVDFKTHNYMSLLSGSNKAGKKATTKGGKAAKGAKPAAQSAKFTAKPVNVARTVIKTGGARGS
jgi:hypothetical protein